MNEDNPYKRIFNMYCDTSKGPLTVPMWDRHIVHAALKFAADAHDMGNGWFDTREIPQPSVQILTVSKDPF